MCRISDVYNNDCTILYKLTSDCILYINDVYKPTNAAGGNHLATKFHPTRMGVLNDFVSKHVTRVYINNLSVSIQM